MIDVVVVAFNNRDHIGSCVRSALEVADGGTVTVVDQGSDGSWEVARDLGVTPVVRPNDGFGAGCNRGAEVGKAPWVLFLNPDARLEPAGVRRSVAAFSDRLDVGALQGSIVNEQSRRPERSQGRELGWWHLLGRAVGARQLLGCSVVRSGARRVSFLSDHVDRLPVSPLPVEYLAATALVVRRVAFEAVGGFDQSYFLYGEDLDLCRRLRREGWILLAVPDLWAFHHGGRSSPTQWDRELAWWQGTMRFAAQWWAPAAWRTSLVAAAIICCRLALQHPTRSLLAWRTVAGGAVAFRREARAFAP